MHYSLKWCSCEARLSFTKIGKMVNNKSPEHNLTWSPYCLLPRFVRWTFFRRSEQEQPRCQKKKKRKEESGWCREETFYSVLLNCNDSCSVLLKDYGERRHQDLHSLVQCSWKMMEKKKASRPEKFIWFCRHVCYLLFAKIHMFSFNLSSTPYDLFKCILMYHLKYL